MSGFLMDLGSRLQLEHYTLPSVMAYTHVHPQYELYFCPQAIEQTSVINGIAYCYCYPCVILSTPYTIHSMSCVTENTDLYNRYVLYFSEQTLNAFAPHLLPIDLTSKNAGLFFPLEETQAEELKALLISCEKAESTSERELIFALFLNRLLRFCPQDRMIVVGDSATYVQDVLQYVATHVSEPLDSDQIAKHFAVSRSKLDRDCKQITGVTVHQFAELCRLNHAKYLLLHHTRLSIREIAQACGFAGESYFFPFFKKHTGITPAEYRQENNKKQ